MSKGDGSIAEAVSRAIRNGSINPVYECSEGFAYKAAFGRQGASIDAMLKAAARDAFVMCVHSGAKVRGLRRERPL